MSGKVLGLQVKEENPEILVESYFGRPSFLNLKEMLADLKVEVFPEDKVTTFPDPSFGLGSQIIIKRAIPVTIFDAAKPTLYRTFKEKVSELLQEKNISLADKDRISPALETKIVRNLEIKITRVQEAEVKEVQSIAFKTIYKDDSTLEKGKTKIAQEGKTGERQLVYKVVREDGKEVSRSLISNNVLRQPQDKIILKGTKEVVLGQGIATWYDWISGLTAAHNTLPYGTKVNVTNLQNGKSVVVTIVDHGIFGRAIIDLSKDAFAQIASLSQGVINVRLTAP